MKPYKITLIVYAEAEAEAKTLESNLIEFVNQKYQQGIYPRAAAISRLITQYGNNALVNAYLK